MIHEVEELSVRGVTDSETFTLSLVCVYFKKRKKSKFSSEQRLFTTAQEPGFRKRNDREG